MYCLRFIATVATAAATAAAIAAATATNVVSVAVTAICWLIVVCPHCCLCFRRRRRCLPPPLPLLAADVIGDGDDCGNGCGGNGGSSDNGAFRSFSRVMFKILHIKSNILNIKPDKEGGGSQNGRGDGSANEGNNSDNRGR